ncbi:hypothetical protein C5167_023231 [Papaver somniferum]|uniref:Uncharacterized protein n=1 Tax=Papaver somniferum TaxID=3469 RepID=A0A4Y7JP05_PAPSO|nr:hypothetical protein C5167_023231 [Papaver somniferum]
MIFNCNICPNENGNRKSGEDPDEESSFIWTEVRRKKRTKMVDIDEVIPDGKQICKIEAKTYSFEKGFGTKAGFFLIKEAKGDNLASLWVSSKGLSWLLATLNKVVIKDWTMMEYWEHIIPGEWLMATRGKNKNEEYLKVSGPNKKGGISDLFFPAGRNLEGWRRIIKSLEMFNLVVASDARVSSSSLEENHTSFQVEPLCLEASLFNEGLLTGAQKKTLFSMEDDDRQLASWVMFKGFHSHYGIKILLKLLGLK